MLSIKIIKGSFSQAFDLKPFPMDTQHLQIMVVMENEAQEFEFSKGKESNKLALTWVTCPPHCEFEEPHEPGVITAVVDTTCDKWSLSRVQYSRCTFKLKVARNPSHALITVALPFWLFTAFVFIVFGVPNDQVSNRLQVITTLFLSSLALRYVASSFLPMISYMTLLDWWILFCTLFVVAVGAENAAGGRLTATADSWWAVSFLILFVGVSLWVCWVHRHWLCAPATCMRRAAGVLE